MPTETNTQPQDPTPCAWWLLCTNDAVATEAHPILGPVPICARCQAKLEALR